MPTLPLSPDELLTTTRTVRKRLDLTRSVPLDLIRECLEVALQAPSGSNRQGWHWMVITDENSRRVIGDYYRQSVASYLNSSGSAAALFPEDPERNPVQRRVGDSVAYLGEHMGEVPVLVIPCISAPRLRAGSQAGLWGSLLPAAWSYMLAARARKLGTAWTTLHLRYERETRNYSGCRPTSGMARSFPLPTTPAIRSSPLRANRSTRCSTSIPGDQKSAPNRSVS
jgi:nitroreductase